MNKAKNILQLIFGIIILSAAGFFLFKLIQLVLDIIDKVDPNIIVALIAGTVTIVGFFITRFLEKKKLSNNKSENKNYLHMRTL